MYLNILDKNRINLLSKIDELSFINDFAMGGGTALSLQLGLRKSYDFDFFTNKHFLAEQLLDEIKQKFPSNVETIDLQKNISTLNLYVNNIQVSFFEYRYPTLNKTILVENMQNINLLSINDIACMKAVALVQRGTKKDFYDLYFILKLGLIDIYQLTNMMKEKFKDENLMINFGYSLSYFDDAEKEVLPQSYVDYSWDEIKSYFLQIQNIYTRLKY